METMAKTRALQLLTDGPLRTHRQHLERTHLHFVSDKAANMKVFKLFEGNL